MTHPQPLFGEDAPRLRLLATLATRGYRPYLMWGGATILLALGVAFVYRFAIGALTPADFVALIGVVGPVMQQLYQRHLEVKNEANWRAAPREAGGLVNPHGGPLAA